MRHFPILIAAGLINLIWATRLLAADAATCTQCTVADAIAKVSQEHDRAQSGLRAGDGDWLLSATFSDLQPRADWRMRFGLTIGVAEQVVRNTGMHVMVDSSWTIGLRFEFSRR